MVFGMVALAGCVSNSGDGAVVPPIQPIQASGVPQSSLVDSSCRAELSQCKDYASMLLRDGMTVQKQLNSYGDAFASLSFMKTPRNPVGGGWQDYEYTYCGEKYAGDRTGCVKTLYCTGSMVPLFNCQERLLFVRSSSYRVGDVVDIDNPGSDLNTIHLIVGLNGGRFITGRFNPGSAGFHAGVNMVDEFQPAASDIKGKLKGVVW